MCAAPTPPVLVAGNCVGDHGCSSCSCGGGCGCGRGCGSSSSEQEASSAEPAKIDAGRVNQRERCACNGGLMVLGLS
jgi:hypothetical protein